MSLQKKFSLFVSILYWLIYFKSFFLMMLSGHLDQRINFFWRGDNMQIFKVLEDSSIGEIKMNTDARCSAKVWARCWVTFEVIFLVRKIISYFDFYFKPICIAWILLMGPYQSIYFLFWFCFPRRVSVIMLCWEDSITVQLHKIFWRNV